MRLLVTIKSLRSIIKRYDPFIIHAHLLKSTWIARLANYKRKNLVATIHSTYSQDAFLKNRWSGLVEKYTVNCQDAVIAISQSVLDDYLEYIPFNKNKFILYNFLQDDYFKKMEYSRSESEVFRCVAVGNLKEAKNYTYLLDIFSHLKGKLVHLDIYGDGPQRKVLQKSIDERKLPVQLCGSLENAMKVLPAYDLFVQTSKHEGFGISVIEAMASKIPIAISDIKVFHEVTGGLAYFLPLSDASQAADIILSLKIDADLRHRYVEQAFSFCRDRYSVSSYKESLVGIYKNLIEKRHA
jgi:glycosyltransferase involved in cell wall biosynthesis